MQFGLRDFTLTVRYTDDFGIDSKFAAKVSQTKLSLGGEFTKQTDTVWQIEGEFGPAGA